MLRILLICLKILKSLDLSNFETSKVHTMGHMFSGCNSLEYLNISNFNTSLVRYFDYMFYGCKKLTSLNISNFDISNAIYISSMFYECNSLMSLNLNNFDTKSSLNLNNFDTKSISSLENMFNGCSSLKSLEIDNFNTSNINDATYMFCGCTQLISLNLSNFNLKSNSDVRGMFDNINNDLIYCANDDQIINLLNQHSGNSNNNCTHICVEYLINKYVIEENKCIINCINDENHRFEYNNQCYSSCPNGTHISLDNNFLCIENIELDNTNIYDSTNSETSNNFNEDTSMNLIDESSKNSDSDSSGVIYSEPSEVEKIDGNNMSDNKCLNSSIESKNNNLCITCNYNENYYPKLDEILIGNNYINCYNTEPEGYYLDRLK